MSQMTKANSGSWWCHYVSYLSGVLQLVHAAKPHKVSRGCVCQCQHTLTKKPNFLLQPAEYIRKKFAPPPRSSPSTPRAFSRTVRRERAGRPSGEAVTDRGPPACFQDVEPSPFTSLLLVTTTQESCVIQASFCVDQKTHAPSQLLNVVLPHHRKGLAPSFSDRSLRMVFPTIRCECFIVLFLGIMLRARDQIATATYIPRLVDWLSADSIFIA